MKQLVHTMFITKNHALFHLWWTETLVKHLNVSKYYGHDLYSNSKLQNSIVKFTVSVFNRKYPFWANSLQIIKILSLNWNLVPKIISIIFWGFLIFYQIFLSSHKKRCLIITFTHDIYELPHELMNDLRLRILGNKKISGKYLNLIEL